jgi:hypothetical protein
MMLARKLNARSSRNLNYNLTGKIKMLVKLKQQFALID